MINPKEGIKRVKGEQRTKGTKKDDRFTLTHIITLNVSIKENEPIVKNLSTNKMKQKTPGHFTSLVNS